MAKDPVATPTAGEGVVSKPIEDFATHAACRIAIPNRHAEGRCGATRKRGEGMRASTEAGVAVSQAPALGLASVEMETAGPGEGQVAGEMGDSRVLDHGGQ